MGILRILVTLLFAVCLALLLISSNLRIMVNTQSFYEYGFDRYDAAATSGIDSDDLSRAAGRLIDYFNGTEDSPQLQVTRSVETVDLFNQREIDHLRDVRGIIQLFYLIQWFTLCYLIIHVAIGLFRRRKGYLRPLMKELLEGGVLTLAIFVFFGLWALIDFDSMFLRFHLSSFSNDLWQLDPSRDHLIMMFPEGFFSDAAMFLVSGTVMEALLITGVCWVLLRRGLPPQLQEAQFPEEQPAQEPPPPPTGTDIPAESREKEAKVDTSRLAS